MSEVLPIAVLTVTHNAAADLPGFFTHLARLAPQPAEVVVVDCASEDGSAAVAREHGARLPRPARVIALGENLGFAGGMNRALAASSAPYVLSLNADAQPLPGCLERLAAVLDGEPHAGAVTPRLRRLPRPGEPPRLDACGMRLTLTWRHLDRGSGEVDQGQYGRPARVFGATGAAALFRREALCDVAVDGEVFDERFHSFREDAELAFRLAERGWSVRYEARAEALHRRLSLPERRAALPAFINYHSLKNRYLLRAYHQTAANFVLTLLPTLGRDLAALLYVLLRERSSLAAYAWLWRHRAAILARRRAIQARRSRPSWEVDRWFFRRELAP